jgi:hypothetical protein
MSALSLGNWISILQSGSLALEVNSSVGGPTQFWRCGWFRNVTSYLKPIYCDFRSFLEMRGKVYLFGGIPF